MIYYSRYVPHSVNLVDYFAAVKPEIEAEDFGSLGVELPSGDMLWCDSRGSISMTESDWETSVFIESISGMDIEALYQLCRSESIMP